MTIQNLHTHTVFGDGKNTAEEMVLGAIAAGCQSLGFSEHSPLPDGLDPEGWSMEAADVPAYRAEVLRLREQYAGRLDIFLGLEQDMDSPTPAFPTDYLIGSVHSVWAEGEYLSVDNSSEKTERAIHEFFGGDPYAYAAAYYRRVWKRIPTLQPMCGQYNGRNTPLRPSPSPSMPDQDPGFVGISESAVHD